MSLPVRAARRDLYANAINEALIARPGTWLTRALVYFDNRGVDGVVNGTAAVLGGSSGRLRRLQTGFVRSYALSMLGGCGARRRGAPGGAVRMTSDRRHSVLLLILLVLPLVGALVVTPLRGNPRGGQAGRAGLRAGCQLVLAAVTWFAYSVPAAEAGTRFQLEFVASTWIPAFGTRFALGIDGIALVMIALIAVLVPDRDAASPGRRSCPRAAPQSGLLRAAAGHRGDAGRASSPPPTCSCSTCSSRPC